MANVQIKTTFLGFEILENETVMTVRYESSEPSNPFWGGGEKKKSFSPERDVIDLIKTEAATQEFLTW